MEGGFLVVEAVSGSLIVRREDKVGGGFSLFFNLLDVRDLQQIHQIFVLFGE